jgi:hypothetical protein
LYEFDALGIGVFPWGEGMIPDSDKLIVKLMKEMLCLQSDAMLQ